MTTDGGLYNRLPSWVNKKLLKEALPSKGPHDKAFVDRLINHHSDETWAELSSILNVPIEALDARARQPMPLQNNQKLMSRLHHINLQKREARIERAHRHKFNAKVEKEHRLLFGTPAPRRSRPAVVNVDHPPSFDSIQQLHALWMQYARTIFLNESTSTPGNLPKSNESPQDSSVVHYRASTSASHGVPIVLAQTNALKADYLGCYMKIVRSRNPSNVGIEGIVVQETKKVFQLITRESRLKLIPKAGTIFSFDVDLTPSGDEVAAKATFQIDGSAFCVSPEDRGNRKWKFSLPHSHAS